MGRPRKRQREEGDHTLASESSLPNFTDVALSKSMDSTLWAPELATFTDDGTGTLNSTSDTATMENQDLRMSSNGVGPYDDYSSDAPFQFAGLSSFLPGSGFPTLDPAQDTQTFSPMMSTHITPMQTLPDLDQRATGDALSKVEYNGCLCLGNLYSTLATFQSLPAPSFPYSMSALRKASGGGHEVVRCQTCPQSYNTAVQNAMLLGTLLHMLINEYSRLLKHIDERAASGESIAFRVGEASSCYDQRHTGTPDCPMAITVDLNGDEWRVLARKAVRQEVVGSVDGNESLVNLVQEMRDRQLVWHESFSKGSHPHDGNAHNDPRNQPAGRKDDPMCAQLMYIDHLKRMLDALEL